MTVHDATTRNTRSDEMNRNLLRRAYECATSSDVPTTQNGSYLSSLDGEVCFTTTSSCNSVVRGMRDIDMATREWRDVYIEHAERNALYAAAREGVGLDGSLLVTTWMPCVECARGIIQAGVAEVLVHDSTYPEHWKESIATARKMLEEAGVVVTVVMGTLGGCAPIRRMGQVVTA